MKNTLAVFEGHKIRRHYDEKTETWFFSLVDIIQALTDSTNPTDYLKKLRKRDLELATYIGTNCPQVEMATESGKNRKTLAGNPEHLLRIIQSVPSKKAELSTRQIAENMRATGMPENTAAGKSGGGIAKKARLELEGKTGEKVVSKGNYLASNEKKRLRK